MKQNKIHINLYSATDQTKSDQLTKILLAADSGPDQIEKEAQKLQAPPSP